MRLEWKKTHSNTHATAEIGRFKFICTNGFDGCKWKVYQHYEGAKPSKEIITLGEVEAKTIDEALECAEDLISEIIPENKPQKQIQKQKNLNWKINSSTFATAELGRLCFWVSDLKLNPKENRTRQYELRHYTNLKDGCSGPAFCIGMIYAKDINEAVKLADESIFRKEESEAENKIGVSLPDGSTLIAMPKDDGGDYPGVYIYRLEPDHEGELDIACVEMPKDKKDAVAVYVYENPESNDYTYSTRIPTGGVSE